MSKLLFMVFALTTIHPALATSCGKQNILLYLHCANARCDKGFLVDHVFTGDVCDQAAEVRDLSPTYLELAKQTISEVGITNANGTYVIEYPGCREAFTQMVENKAFDYCRKPVKAIEKASSETEHEFEARRAGWQSTAARERAVAMLWIWVPATVFLVFAVALLCWWPQGELRKAGLVVLFVVGFLRSVFNISSPGPQYHVACYAIPTLVIAVFGIVNLGSRVLARRSRT